jgi:uncharacterized protein (DUF1697 family)
MRYVAFLRGINVGGKTQVKMEELRPAFESLGFQDVTTLLNSGNVVFEAAEVDAVELTRRIEAKLAETFARALAIVLRSADAIRALLDAEPFASVTVTPQTRLYVTFLGGAPATWRAGSLSIPYVSPEGNVHVLHVADGAICSAIVLAPQQGTVDLMKFLEDAYGKSITTRNWNTVIKVAQRLGIRESGA